MNLKWIAVLISQVNNYRSRYSLPKMTYNYTVMNELQDIVNELGPSWFYEKGSECNYVPIVNRTQCNRGDFVNPLGFNLLFHDTYRGKKLGNRHFNQVINYRIGQDRCFNYDACSTTEYSDSITCLKKPPVMKWPDPCIWAWYYTPRLLWNFTQLSCIQLDYETGYAPKKQQFSFYCYANYQKPISDSFLNESRRRPC